MLIKMMRFNTKIDDILHHYNKQDFFYLVNYCQIDQSLTTVQVFSELRSHEIHQKANYFSTLTTYIF